MTPPLIPTKDAYLAIALRCMSVASAALAMAQPVQEAAGFYAYHAFESIGGALLTRNGWPVPWKHPHKISQFEACALAHGYPFEPDVAALAIQLDSIRCSYSSKQGRDELLYPTRRPGGGVAAVPHDSFTVAQAQALVGDVGNLIAQIQPHV
jgi:hypothetical protein